MPTLVFIVLLSFSLVPQSSIVEGFVMNSQVPVVIVTGSEKAMYVVTQLYLEVFPKPFNQSTARRYRTCTNGTVCSYGTTTVQVRPNSIQMCFTTDGYDKCWLVNTLAPLEPRFLERSEEKVVFVDHYVSTTMHSIRNIESAVKMGIPVFCFQNCLIDARNYRVFVSGMEVKESFYVDRRRMHYIVGSVTVNGISSPRPFIARVCDGSPSALFQYFISCQLSSTQFPVLVRVWQSTSYMPDGRPIDDIIGLFSTNTFPRAFAICVYHTSVIDAAIGTALREYFEKKSYVEAWSLRPKLLGSVDQLKFSGCDVPEDLLFGTEKVLDSDFSLAVDSSGSAFRLVGLWSNQSMLITGYQNGTLVKELISGNERTSVHVIDTGVPGGITSVTTDVDDEVGMASGLRSVYSFLITNCSALNTCYSCVEDPFCAWVTLSALCKDKRKLAARNQTAVTSSTQCQSIRFITPSSVISNNDTTVVVETDSFPPGGVYRCRVEKYIVGLTRISQNTFTCLVPRPMNYGFYANKGVEKMELSLLTKMSDYPLATTTLEVFSCSILTSCSQCIGASKDCVWCLQDLTCKMNTDNCSNERQLSISSQSGSASDMCTHVPQQEVFIPHDEPTNITLIGVGLPPHKATNTYSCILSDGNISQKTDAVPFSVDRIVCYGVKFTYQNLNQTRPISIDVMLGNEVIGSGIEGRVFLCHFEAKDCSSCLATSRKTGCVWCRNFSICSRPAECSESADLTCPAPVISQVSPMIGVVGSKHIIQIEGSELGSSPDLILNVMVASLPCIVIKEQFRPSRGFNCSLTSDAVERSGPVQLVVQSGTLNQTAMFDGTVSFFAPVVTGLHPLFGLKSGRTLVTISGRNFEAANRFKVSFSQPDISAPHLEATSISFVNGSLQLYPPLFTEVLESDVFVTFDDYKVRLSERFNIVQDPTVDSVETRAKTKKVFRSGGQVLEVRGKQLGFVHQPLMVFVPSGQEEIMTQCKHDPVTMNLLCLTPNMTHLHSPNTTVFVNVGFILDGIEKFKRFTDLEVQDDPLFLGFTDELQKKRQVGGDLLLKGYGLDILSSADITVMIGEDQCMIDMYTRLEQTVLCRIPSSAGSSSEGEINWKPVTVQVGQGGLSYSIGKLQYSLAKTTLPTWVFVLIGVFVGIIIIVSLSVVFLCSNYRRGHKKEKLNQHNLQKEMITMESNMAKGCRDAFVEHLMEPQDSLIPVAPVVVPSFEFEKYAVHVLFPGLEYHPVLNTEVQKPAQWVKTVSLFAGLLREERFVLAFVRKLEEEPTFNMMDRCKVASLLTVGLHHDIPMMTSVLLQLLRDLIAKNTKKGGHPKLLLRRTESVAEKLLTNWLTYLLYDHLLENITEPLFTLMRAIRQTLNRGPVDALTGDATSALSEDKVLRCNVDYKVFTGQVAFDYEGRSEKVKLQLVDCDTVSQVKDKVLDLVFANVAFSKRPRKEEFKLVNLVNQYQRIILDDLDGTSVNEGVWKKMNTMKHYMIDENTTLLMSLVSAEEDVQSDQQNSGNIPEYFSPVSWSQSLPLLQGSTSCKVYHMVKTMESHIDSAEDHTKQLDNLTEAYLTRLLRTKKALHKYIKNLLLAVFSVGSEKGVFPLAIKYLFDFLDEQASTVTSSVAEQMELAHIWKNNSIPLRFWVNIIKNPNFIIDAEKGVTMDSFLSVIAQLLMDMCSPNPVHYGKDAPSNKLLFAKHINEYKMMVKDYYEKIRMMPPIDPEVLADALQEKSESCKRSQFNPVFAHADLLSFAVKYKDGLLSYLNQEEMQNYADKLIEIFKRLPLS